MFLDANFGENVKKLLQIKSVTIDGPIFNLHCKVTTLALFFACATLSLKQYVGEDGPIQCIVSGFREDKLEKEHTKAVQTFCWIHSTFTLSPNTTTDDEGNAGEENRQRIYHKYYQWVCLVLFLQATAFYIPKFLWKQSEGRLMEYLMGTDVPRLSGKEERMTMKNDLVNYFVWRLKGHRKYATTYWLCEFLCLMNIIAQVFALDRFLNDNFLMYGLRAFDSIKFDPEYPLDGIFAFPDMTTMDYVFPMQTKCRFYKYGNSGNINVQDALCVLVLNSFNRYIFLVVWYWFLTLSVLLTLLLFYRIACLFTPQLRCIHLRTGKNDLKSETNFVARNLSVTDWWVLYSLKSNINSILFQEIVFELSLRLRTRQKQY